MTSYQLCELLPEMEEAAVARSVLPQVAEDEPALVERACSDPAAFGKLYEHYVDRVYSYPSPVFGNSQEAEDAPARSSHRGAR